ncbi:MAG: hypothetical protein H3C43_08890 [Leptonema sp. (in: Bacteria)]|nr:hypothetical protein [Leptonema sp. (in: bacteria)]
MPINSQNFIASIKNFIWNTAERPSTQTLFQDLEYQCERLSPIAIVSAFVIWLPYIPIDIQILPEVPVLVLIRVGFTLVGLVSFAILMSKPFQYWGFVIGILLVVYMLWGAATVAILSNGAPAYIGGFILCLLVVTFAAPLPLSWIFGIFTLSYVYLFGGFWLFNVSLDSHLQRYSIQDLTTVILVSYGFSAIQYRVRKANFIRSKTFEEKKTESNRLLQSIIPKSISETQGQLKPNRFENVTILFTGFERFSEIAGSLPADETVNQLNKLFIQFSEICDNHQVEKIKTVGDRFIACAGLPKSSVTHAIDCCLVAVKIQSLMQEFNTKNAKQGLPQWRLRIGIHSGPVIAGVIGQRKFLYDIWGQTVNIASMLEENSVTNRINISRSTYDLVKNGFECSYRGISQTASKSKIDMFFLEGIQPYFSVKGQGKTANQDFVTFYKQILSNKLKEK